MREPALVAGASPDTGAGVDSSDGEVPARSGRAGRRLALGLHRHRRGDGCDTFVWCTRARPGCRGCRRRRIARCRRCATSRCIDFISATSTPDDPDQWRHHRPCRRARHLRHTDGVMLGRAAYHDPYFLRAAWRGISLGDDIASATVSAARAGPYVRTELAHGTALKHITRHIAGLFTQPGGRAFRQILSEGAAWGRLEPGGAGSSRNATTRRSRIIAALSIRAYRVVR